MALSNYVPKSAQAVFKTKVPIQIIGSISGGKKNIPAGEIVYLSSQGCYITKLGHYRLGMKGHGISKNLEMLEH